MTAEPLATLATTDLIPLLQKLFVKQGMFAAQAKEVATSLLWAEWAQRPAFGIELVGPMFAAADAGQIDPRGQLLVSSSVPGVQEIVGSRLPGPVALDKAQALAVKGLKELPAINVLVTLSHLAWPGTAALAVAATGAVVKVTLTGETPPYGPTAPMPFPYTVWGLPTGDGGVIIVENPIIESPATETSPTTPSSSEEGSSNPLDGGATGQAHPAASLFEQPVEFVLTAFKDEIAEVVIQRLAVQGRRMDCLLPAELSIPSAKLIALRTVCENCRVPFPW